MSSALFHEVFQRSAPGDGADLLCWRDRLVLVPSSCFFLKPLRASSGPFPVPAGFPASARLFLLPPVLVRPRMAKLTFRKTEHSPANKKFAIEDGYHVLGGRCDDRTAQPRNIR
ncbi:hypothetical protein STXM2123_62 [Streptomyces sp. F-3]|nr:hypothetical protein STXM2123_62 [Streptomyces sp. F-3]